MIKITKNYQIMIYAVLSIFSVLFFFYFYRQASITTVNIIDSENIASGQVKKTVFSENTDLNLDFFNSDKFRNLRSNVAPTVNFQSEKRNPFLPD
jgi:hypothetical protein